LLKYPESFKDVDKREWLDFVMKFQQITGPVTAKGIEDTTFYIYNRLVSLNEVGGSPERFGIPMETFHGQNRERSKCWPHTMNTTSTHDSKRSEDVRSRINVLTEIPEEWREHLIRWRRINKKKMIVFEGQTVPDPNEEYLLYQTLVGVWPVESMSASEYETFKKRIKDYMIKALREAKVNTSWINPNTNYEKALTNFVDAILNNTRRNKFLEDFHVFQKKISHYGFYNSLSQTLLKITSPGVPDFYQGTELWDFSLVDPDNRRPVDYGIRMGMLEELKRCEAERPLPELARELTIKKDNGKIKLYLIYKALNYRKTAKAVFQHGDYLPLEALGEKAHNVCTFARKWENSVVLIIVPRFLTKLIQQPEGLPFGKEVWKDSYIVVPFENPGTKYQNIFTREIVTTASHKEATVLYISEIFTHFPVVLMERIA
jgi:(1->4)-alpha-D-glucan 1-alpha-D-glucosylmutase